MTTEGKQALVRLTVNLIPKAAEAIDHAVALSRDSKTDTVNRALQLYDFFLTEQAQGSKVYVRRQDSGELELIRML